jgi:hypothetical protein
MRSPTVTVTPRAALKVPLSVLCAYATMRYALGDSPGL